MMVRWNEPFPQAYWQGHDFLPAALGHSLPGLRNVRGVPCSLLRRHASCGLFLTQSSPRTKAPPGSLRREAPLLPGPLSPPMNPACVPGTCSRIPPASALRPPQAAPAAPGPLSALPPLSPGTRLTSITPSPFLPRSLRRVSRLCEFPGSSPQRCRCTRKPDSLREFTIRPPSVLPLPGESPVLRPSHFHHARHFHSRCPARAAPLPPDPSSRGRTNPPRKGCDALRPGVSAQSPSPSLRTVPGIPRTRRTTGWLSPPRPFPGCSMRCRLLRRESPEAGP